MTEQITSVELPNQTVDIQDKLADTPRSIEVTGKEQGETGQAYTNVLFAVATATQIFGYAWTTDFLNSKDITCLSNEEQASKPAFYVPYPIEVHSESTAERANQTRLELLARLYVSKKLLPEEDARLAIVTEKVRRLIPRVSADDFEALGVIAQDSEAIRVKNEERRRRLGI
jgi:hypothetical protein